MTVLIVNLLLMALLVVLVVLLMRTNRLFAVVVLSGAYSLICAAIFVNLDAVDVAFTEAAVGAGVSTVLFLAAMAYLPAEERQPARSHRITNNLAGVLICVAAGAMLMLAAAELPAVGDPNGPAQTHVAPRYLAESGTVLKIPNVVTTVLASYRGFDTFGETVVVFAAGLGVLLLLGGVTRTGRASAPKVAAKAAVKAAVKTPVKKAGKTAGKAANKAAGKTANKAASKAARAKTTTATASAAKRGASS